MEHTQHMFFTKESTKVLMENHKVETYTDGTLIGTQ